MSVYDLVTTFFYRGSLYKFQMALYRYFGFYAFGGRLLPTIDFPGNF